MSLVYSTLVFGCVRVCIRTYSMYVCACIMSVLYCVQNASQLQKKGDHFDLVGDSGKVLGRVSIHVIQCYSELNGATNKPITQTMRIIIHVYLYE